MKSLLRILPVLLFFAQSLTYAHDSDNTVKFVENKGQWPKQVNFKSYVSGGQIWLENNKISYQFTKYPNLHANFKSKEEPVVQQHVVWAEFVGANSNFEIVKKLPSKDYNNYFIGNDKSKWVSEAYAYADIKYVDYYNNTDLRIYQQEGHLKYDFIVKSKGENNIKIKYSGQDKIKINRRGELVIETTLGQVIEEKPYAYQIMDGVQKEVSCKFLLMDNTVSFSLGKYNKNFDLIIDPVLVFASYNGSPSDNYGMTATYDNEGHLYSGGTVFGAGYPTTPGIYDPTGNFPDTISSATFSPVYGVTDVFISKYAPDGTSLIYSTYLGGGSEIGGTEAVHSLICDSLGNLHLFGTTSSSDFPTTPTAYQDSLKGGSFQSFQFNSASFWDINHIGGGTDIFVTKFNATGSALLGSTFIGGSKNDGLNYNLSGGSYNSINAYDSLTNNYGDQFRGEIMIDNLGFIYIVSSTYSSDFPTPGGFQPNIGGSQDAVVCKFSPNLDNLIWSSFVGGTDKDAGYGIKLNANHDVYITGGTCSSNGFPTTLGTLNPNYIGGISDGYMMKIDKNGGSILASTFIGTNLYDQNYFVEIDRFGTIYTVGQTKGAIPVFNSNYSDPNSGAFIMRIDSNLTTIDYSTVFGNGDVNAQFSPSAFLVDRCQNVYVSGWGGSVIGGSPLTGMSITTNSITSATGNTIPTTSGDGFNFYLTVFERDMQSQLFGIYYGSPNSGDHVDGGTSRFDKNGIIYQSVCAGCGSDDNFPTTTGVVSEVNNSTNCNNGVFKFDFEIIPKAQFTVDEFQGCAPLEVNFTNTSHGSDTYLWDFGGGDTTSLVFNPVRNYATPGTYNVSLLIQDSICNTVDTAFQIITVAPPITVVGGNTINICEDTVTLFISTTGNPTEIVWSTNNQFTDTLNPNPLDSSLFVTLSDTNWYYVMASNNLCSSTDSFLVNNVSFQIETFNDTTCNGTQTTINTSTTSNQSLIYNWTPLASIISGTNTATPTVNPVITTDYFVIVDNGLGCIEIDSLTITVVPQVGVTGGNTVTTCDTVTLNISTTGNPTTIIWSSNNLFTDTLTVNDSSLLVTPTDTSWYYVTVINGPCFATDSFLVNYSGFNIETFNGAVCSGNADTLEVTTTSSQFLTYNWTPLIHITSGANTPNPIVHPTSTTTYYLSVNNNFGCNVFDSAQVLISQFDASTINLWADKDTLYSSETTQLHVTPNTGFTFQWTPTFSLNNPLISDPLATPVPPSITDYTVVLKQNGFECEFAKTLRIYALELNCGEPDIFIPNAFTPNADNENDILLVRGKTVEKMYLKIYDRWGELVFETDKQSEGWNGQYKGNLVDPGVFVYHLEITCVDGQEYFKKGNVTVIR